MHASTLLALVRHGETRANLEGLWHGSTDTPLTERGREQARRVAQFLAAEHAGAAAVYSSPLQRALDTARSIGSALDLPVRVHGGLSEYDLGAWEGRSFRELFGTHDLLGRMRSDPDYAPHGGESPRQVTARLAGALREIADLHAQQRVIVVSHGGALSMALAALVDGADAAWHRVMDNCAVSELAFGPAPRLVRFNLTTHLEGA